MKVTHLVGGIESGLSIACHYMGVKEFQTFYNLDDFKVYMHVSYPEISLDNFCLLWDKTVNDLRNRGSSTYLTIHCCIYENELLCAVGSASDLLGIVLNRKCDVIRSKSGYIGTVECSSWEFGINGDYVKVNYKVVSSDSKVLHIHIFKDMLMMEKSLDGEYYSIIHSDKYILNCVNA